LTRVGPLMLADLVIVDEADAGKAGAELDVEPVVTSGRLQCSIDIRTDPGALPPGARVSIDVAGAATGRSAVPAAAVPLVSSSDGARHIVRTTIDTSKLAPGSYVARAIVSIDGKRAGEVSRQFQNVMRAPR